MESVAEDKEARATERKKQRKEQCNALTELRIEVYGELGKLFLALVVFIAKLITKQTNGKDSDQFDPRHYLDTCVSSCKDCTAVNVEAAISYQLALLISNKLDDPDEIIHALEEAEQALKDLISGQEVSLHEFRVNLGMFGESRHGDAEMYIEYLTKVLGAFTAYCHDRIQWILELKEVDSTLLSEVVRILLDLKNYACYEEQAGRRMDNWVKEPY